MFKYHARYGGVDPLTMLTGPIPATKELLDQTDMTVDDIDRFEVNEAFASVIAAWLDETGADWEKTNVWGGAIAHGHPLGATGAALLGKLPYQLAECNGQYGLCTMCIGFGQGDRHPDRAGVARLSPGFRHNG